MGMITPYCTDEEVISNLKSKFTAEEQENINFKSWFNTLERTQEGVIVQITNRKFLIHDILGVVIKEWQI